MNSQSLIRSFLIVSVRTLQQSCTLHCWTLIDWTIKRNVFFLAVDVLNLPMSLVKFFFWSSIKLIDDGNPKANLLHSMHSSHFLRQTSAVIYTDTFLSVFRKRKHHVVEARRTIRKMLQIPCRHETFAKCSCHSKEIEVRRRSVRNNSMADDQINEFEGTYGVDPDYDEPYTVDELPYDMSFVEDKVYGDRRYEKGQIFYRNESDNDLYWRQGCRPLLKQFS
jgi:hypothetical protein